MREPLIRFASGLAIICTGKFTKRINEFMAQEKEYTGTITLGAVTPTYDLESKPENPQEYRHLTNDQIMNGATPFLGDILQYPPVFSAIKKQVHLCMNWPAGAMQWNWKQGRCILLRL